jgi:hypothetical protein
MTRANQPNAAKPAIAARSRVGAQRRGVSDPGPSPAMRAQRAKPKSCRDDEIIALGKRSAALGYGRKMIPSFFPSGFARQGRAKPEGKKEVGCLGSLPRAAASAVLSWAIILLLLRGARGRENWRLGSTNQPLLKYSSVPS